MNTGIGSKRDGLLLAFAIFDMLNVVLFVFAFFNMSLNAICVIFALGVCNLLFAAWAAYRRSRAEYVRDYGMTGVKQSGYYVRSIFTGAILIAADLAVVVAGAAVVLKNTLGRNVDSALVDKCHSGQSIIIDYDLSSYAQYILNHLSCYFGEGHFFTLVGPYDPNFLVSLLQAVMQKLILHPSGYLYALYGLCLLVAVPFIWLLYRMFHVINMIRKNEC